MKLTPRLRLLGALALLGTAFWVGRSFILKDWNMNEPITLPPTHTVCVGRYLLDLPVSLELGGEVELYYGLDKNFRTVKVEVLRETGTTPTLEDLVKKRQAELLATNHLKAPSKNMLILSKSVADKTVLIRSYESIESLRALRSEIYREIGGAVAVFTDTVYENDNPEEIEAKVLRVAQRSQYLDPASPETPMRGTCLGNVVIDAGQDREDFFMAGGFGDKLPDVRMDFSSVSISSGEDGGLFQRLASKAPMLLALGVHTDEIRRSQPMLGGMPAQEILDKGKDHGKLFRQFTIESMPLRAHFGTPKMQMSLHMGGQVNAEYVDPSWSERQAIAIWDAIVKSVRLRPGAL